MGERWESRVVAVAGLAVMLGCVQVDPLRWQKGPATFNDRIRPDMEPLTPDDVAIPPGFGFLRDGSTGGLVSEVFPVSASSPTGGPGWLVQTPCLFVGSELDSSGATVASDELRLAWEVVARYRAADDASDSWKEVIGNSTMDLGLCSLSTVRNRLLFDYTGAPLRSLSSGLTECPVGEESNEPAGLMPVTFVLEPKENYNTPFRCVAGHVFHEVVLQRVAAPGSNPDGTCPVTEMGDPTHFDGERKTLVPDDATGWYRDGHWSVCGVRPNHHVPTGDASFRLSLKDGHSFDSPAPERWLSPSALTVAGRRTIVRPLTPTAPGSAQVDWRTAVASSGGDVPAVRWGENFTPTVRVAVVEVVSRDASGGDTRPQAVRGGELRILIPRPGDPAADVRCTLRTDETAFHIPDDCSVEDQPELGLLTPTYAIPFLHRDQPVTQPVTWTVELDGLPSGRTPFIRFELRASAQPPLLRVSSLVDFGRLQRDGSRSSTVAIENVGGQPLQVREVGWGPGSRHPGDFSFVVTGDPAEVPLPYRFETKPGGTTLKPTADVADAPLVRVTAGAGETAVTLGDPTRGAGTEHLTLYGEPVRLEGNLLVREDPASVFVPAGPSGPRPTVVAVAVRAPPFVLAPGETALARITARPTALGVRDAFLRVSAVPLTGPSTTLTAQSVVRVEAIQGPQLNLTPRRLWFDRPSSATGQEHRRAAMIDNVGTLPLDVTRIRLQGPHASRFSFVSERGLPPFRLPSADYDDIRVTYAPECDGTYGSPGSVVDHRATLVVDSTGGRVELVLEGSSRGFCPAP
ncbi:MAG: hypothetical protein ABW221_02150 [Vicinamibacteria bacterium]